MWTNKKRYNRTILTDICNRADRNDMKIIAARKKNRHLNLHKIKKYF